MFTIESLTKLKIEFFDSLIDRYSKARRKIKLKENQKKTFEYYRENLSYAGMETWLESLDEKIFFEDSLSHLRALKSDNELISFKDDLLFSIKNSFRDEDFRFNIIEKSGSSRVELNKNILIFINELDSSLSNVKIDLNPNHIPNYYYKTNGKPSQLGLKTRLEKRKIPIIKLEQLSQAETELALNWEYGYNLFKTLTNKILIVSSPDLVSYSHLNEFGISYINLIDRDLFDTIDDLVHENSHHHLNLIIKKYKLLKNIDDNIVFYSPWRDSLRNTYAILHSVFTFSHGALLFENILNNPSPFMKKNFERVAFRFVEESIMLEYSLYDLLRVEENFYEKGKQILRYLFNINNQAKPKMSSIKKIIKSKMYKKRLSELEKKLKIAIKIYR